MASVPVKVQSFGSPPPDRPGSGTIQGFFDPGAAVEIAKLTLLRQRQDLFATQGRSDGGTPWPAHRGDSSRSVLTSTGKLRDLVEFEVQLRPRGFRLTMFSAPGLGLVSNVHQHGTKLGKDIVPINAKALFIPTSGRGAGSVREISAGKPMRIGSTATRRGKAPRRVSLKQQTLIRSGKRKGQRTKGDFALVSRIPATAEKGNRAIPKRQHFRVTRQSAEEVLANIVADSPLRR